MYLWRGKVINVGGKPTSKFSSCFYFRKTILVTHYFLDVISHNTQNNNKHLTHDV